MASGTGSLLESLIARAGDEVRSWFGDEDADVITPKGMEQLKKVMPQIAEKDLDGKFSPEDVMSHFTVANLTELVASRA